MELPASKAKPRSMIGADKRQLKRLNSLYLLDYTDRHETPFRSNPLLRYQADAFTWPEP